MSYNKLTFLFLRLVQILLSKMFSVEKNYSKNTDLTRI